MVRGFVVALSLALGIFAYLPSAFAQPFTAYAALPAFPPLIVTASEEVRLQAACRSEAVPAEGDHRLALLRPIEIRTALEDTARLHNDLG